MTPKTVKIGTKSIEWKRVEIKQSLVFDAYNVDEKSLGMHFQIELFHQGFFKNTLIACGDCRTNRHNRGCKDEVLILRNPQTNASNVMLTIRIEMKPQDQKVAVDILKLEQLILNDYEYGDYLTNNRMVLFGLLLFVLFIILNSCIMHRLQLGQWTLFESLWFTIATVTTVGFGDLTPIEDKALLFNCITITISTVLIGWIFGHAMNYLFLYDTQKKRKQKIKHNIYRLKRLPSVENSDNEPMDIDDQQDELENDTIINGMKLRKTKLIQTLVINSIIIALLIFIGSIFFYTFEFQDHEENDSRYIESLHFVLVTMSTVGYGDYCPNTAMGKVIATLYIFIGLAVVGLLVTLITDYKQQQYHQ